MVITKRIAPCPSPQLLDLWKNTFGEAEANLETPQIDGSELDNNMDILYLAEDGQTLAGSIHATLPNHARTLCGLSGMCVAPRYRGIGLSRTLFAHMMSYLEGSGTNAFFSVPITQLLPNCMHRSALAFCQDQMLWQNLKPEAFSISVDTCIHCLPKPFK